MSKSKAVITGGRQCGKTNAMNNRFANKIGNSNVAKKVFGKKSTNAKDAYVVGHDAGSEDQSAQMVWKIVGNHKYVNLTPISNNSYNQYINFQQYQQLLYRQIINNNSPMFNTAAFSTPDSPESLDRDPNFNDDFGWRCWSWDKVEKKLYSPVQNTLWPQAENHAHIWDESDVCRGKAGIHARFVPNDWQDKECPDGVSYANLGYDYYFKEFGVDGRQRIEITGIVERFGKYVQGTNGWRSEWAIIRKLYAPEQAIGLALEAAFPEVEVIYAEPKPRCKYCGAMSVTKSGICYHCEKYESVYMRYGA